MAPRGDLLNFVLAPHGDELLGPFRSVLTSTFERSQLTTARALGSRRGRAGGVCDMDSTDSWLPGSIPVPTQANGGQRKLVRVMTVASPYRGLRRLAYCRQAPGVAYESVVARLPSQSGTSSCGNVQAFR